jgi:DNA polymerase III subunit gamma/tau
MSVLQIKYRPQDFSEVIGQKDAVASLRQVLKEKRAHSFLFIGPSGTGKTTIARIAAGECGCLPRDIIEIDAASNTGVDDMRKLQDVLQYRPFGEGKARGIILDECHMLSKAAWNSLLKVTEEPPTYVYFFLCTTEPGKVPATIRNRCHQAILKAVSDKDLNRILNWVAEEEQLDVDETVAQIIVKEAKGSPRQLLVNLAAAGHCTNKTEAAAALHSALETDAILEFCRFMTTNGSWVKAMGVVEKLEGTSPESARIVFCNYMASVLKSAKTEEKAMAGLRLLECFSTPYNASEGMAPLYLSIGRALYAAD